MRRRTRSGNRGRPTVSLSPAAGEFPEKPTQALATIVDGDLDPDRFAGQIGTGFELTIEGDGTEQTLVIADLVAETAIAPDGATTVALVVGGEPGESAILLDGETGGAFARQSGGGITDT